jgi:stress response protein YsnF
VILQAERVQITTQVVPVERVRMVRRVLTSAQTITEPVRSEQMALEQTDMPGPRPGDNQEETR